MASTFSQNLSIELIGTGDQAGTWGTTTNSNLGTLIEQAISGYVTQAVSTGTDTTITIPNGTSGVARNMYIELTGTGGASTNLIVPANKKLYFIFNNSTGAVTVKVSGQTGVSVPTGKKMVLVSNGTDIVNGLNYIADFASNSATITHLSATSASITNLTLTSLVISNLSIASANITTLTGSTQTLSGNLTLNGGTANGVAFLNASKVVTSGTALVFDGTNLGIGTASPVNRLDVQHTTNGIGMRLRNSSTGVELATRTDATTSGIDAGNASNGMTFSLNTVEGMRLTSTGLGIGTASPGYKLDVNTTGGSAATARLNGNDQSNVRLRLENTGSGGRTWELVGGLPGANNANFSIRDVTGSTTPLTIDSSGNLGIGTASPGYRLHVAQTSGNDIGFFGTSAGGGGRIVFSDGNSGTAASVPRIGANANDLLFYTNTSGNSATERARITSDGNIVAGASAALATTATNGFLYVPTCAGTPTGTPTAITGMAPIVVDTTNNKLYFYSSGVWRDAGP